MMTSSFSTLCWLMVQYQNASLSNISKGYQQFPCYILQCIKWFMWNKTYNLWWRSCIKKSNWLRWPQKIYLSDFWSVRNSSMGVIHVGDNWSIQRLHLRFGKLWGHVQLWNIFDVNLCWKVFSFCFLQKASKG